MLFDASVVFCRAMRACMQAEALVVGAQLCSVSAVRCDGLHPSYGQCVGQAQHFARCPWTIRYSPGAGGRLQRCKYIARVTQDQTDYPHQIKYSHH